MKRTTSIAALSIFLAAPCFAQGNEGVRGPLQLIEGVCVQAALTVNEARQGEDVSRLLVALRTEDPSIRVEMLNRLQADEIERGLRAVVGGQPWDANREAALCLERNRHVALAYLTAD